MFKDSFLWWAIKDAADFLSDIFIAAVIVGIGSAIWYFFIQGG